ncbi:sulfatase-like hydrolase/transferase [Buttiauxella selenatireducens]|uniref:Sulfatase-like hydrolase/transferase n=1 Tax=Buttiauxella selenatireducens TaxID=3073902 RepID=A0ABY9S541_9ENTR|nr:sulfatase-like hydrolase/transferase [Buttiauxella sp. R73]WMY72522.1 sulfatase-like hydrolase/transferase [Buttiauxella sp. R73]
MNQNTTAPRNNNRPNVLFISVDQWPAHLFGFAGNQTIETPTIDNLARSGICYSSAYTECPICIPARRSMMTGTSPRTHGDRIFQPTLPMPALPTLAQVFTQAGYQTQAIGKLHAYPPRDRIGFEEAFIAEEGRSHLGGVDDYEIFLAEQGYAGQQFMHGMSNNEYSWRTWHLDEHLHVTNWITATAAKNIRRRDPTRPGFWHVSYTQPHPPITPLQSYLDRYRHRQMETPVASDWSHQALTPWAVKMAQPMWGKLTPVQHADMRRAFYAQCTHIDHQLRLLIGTLREEGILDNTIILFTSDHGDMLGDHGLYAKRFLYQGSIQVPMILVDRAGSHESSRNTVDNRLVALQDIMPTLLSLCDIPVPESCDGFPMTGTQKRQTLYCESMEGPRASRMITDGQYKLLWYPAGNHFQLFDVVEDPGEQNDLFFSPDSLTVIKRLRTQLMSELYGNDLQWLTDGTFVGCDEPPLTIPVNRDLGGQRGIHFPPLATASDPGRVVGFG